MKFFRLIRKRLLRENRFTRYLIYAIGEIILVVIGILIALQINNWNERRKTSLVERGYLEALSEDIGRDILLQDSLLSIYDLKFLNLDTLLYVIQRRDSIDGSNTAFKYYKLGLGFPDYRVKDHTIETLRSSGNIEIISDEGLRTSIQSYYDRNELINIKQEVLNEVLSTALLEKNVFDLIALRNANNPEPVPYLDYSALETKPFYNSLIVYELNFKDYRNTLADLKKNAEKIKESIDLWLLNDD